MSYNYNASYQEKAQITNGQTIKQPGHYALDACQNNPDFDGSLRQVLNEISTNAKGYYRIGGFYIYRVSTNTETTIKIDLMLIHNVIFFFGENNNNPVNGTVSRNGAIINKLSDDNDISIVIDKNNNKISFNLRQWSTLYLISTVALTGIETY